MKVIRLLILAVAAIAISATPASAADEPAPPNISVLTAGPADGTTATTPDVTWGYSWNDQTEAQPWSPVYGLLLGFYCSLDQAAFAPCGASFSAPGLSEGPHTFAVYASYVGNVIDCPPVEEPGPLPCEPALAPVSTETLFIDIVVDTAPPNLAITAGPAQGASSNQTFQRIGFDASDGGSFTTTCALDGAAPSGCSSPADLTELADGRHRFTVIAADANGHSTTATRSFTIDTTSPVAAFTGGPGPGATIRSNHPTIYFAATDLSGVNYLCAFDSGEPAPCVSPFRRSKLKAGAHVLVVTPTDAVGNIGRPIIRMFTFKPIKRCVKHKHVRGKHGKRLRVCAKYRLASL